MGTQKITGEWIREQCEKAYRDYSELNFNPSTFNLNPEITKLRQSIKYYQSLCPHFYNNNNTCIYCKKIKSEGAETNE